MLDRALSVSLRLLTNADVEEIALGGVQEDGVTEFKSALDEGAERDQTTWADGGKLSRTAKADLLRAVIAFANAYGGTLYLGVAESDDEPKRSCGLSPVRRIFELETALCDAMRDTIEPRLPSFDSRAFAFEADAGVLAIRVPASPLAPHWNSSERQCYQRIGSSSQKVGMREIQSLTLDRSRTSQNVNALFADRRAEFESLLGQLVRTVPIESDAVWLDSSFRSSGTAMRCTGVPLVPINVEHITERPDLRIGVRPVRVRSKIAVPGEPSEQGIRSWDNIDPREFEPALRGWSHIFRSPHTPMYNSMVVRSDGLIERIYCDLTRATIRPDGRPNGVNFVSLVAFVLSVLTSIEVFRKRTGTSEVPYELEFDLISQHGQTLIAPDYQMRGEHHQFKSRRTVFPRFLVGRSASFSAIGDALQTDIWNSASEKALVFYEYDVEHSLRLHESAH